MSIRPLHEPPPEEGYLKEVLLHPWSVNGLIGAVATGAVLSIPYGLGMGAIPLVLFGGLATLAGLFIPGSAAFRERVDRKRRRERREKTRSYLLTEVNAQVDAQAPPWQVYQRLLERVGSLQVLANDARTGVTQAHVEQLDDATVNFLGQWLASLNMWSRWREIDEHALQERIDHIERQLGQATSDADRAHLNKARRDLTTLLERKGSLWGRATAVDAALLSMADAFEEVFQQVIRNPTSGSVGHDLKQAVERMHIEEELELAVEAELTPHLHRARAKVAEDRSRIRSRAQKSLDHE